MVSKKEISDARKTAEKYDKKNAVTKTDLDAIWDTVNEMQKNLEFINARLARVLDRMGLE
jgi:hypothetical protein|tara:strand:- start:4799 stop:4978 length:180 start_codon:yes stop_codon:yes gene_type:complete